MVDQPIFAPDGSVRSIPDDQVQNALSSGGKRAIKMLDPQGTQRYVPEDMVSQAQQAGGKLVEVQSQPPQDHQSIADFAKEWWQQVNPGAAITGMRDAVNHPIDTANNLLQGQSAILDKAKEAFQNGRYAEGVRHSLNYLLPVIGQQTDRAGDLADQGKFASAAGATAGLATNIAAPELVKNISIPAAAKTAMQNTATDMYQGALKPRVTLPIANVKQMVQTGLEKGIPVTAEGLTKISDLVDDLNSKIGAEIKAKPNVAINKYKVASRLNSTAQDFATQVNPTKDLKAVSEAGNDFLATQPGAIPAAQAQAVKVGTYQQLAGKYGELGNATMESQKALARGLKEELAKAFPELDKLNAQEGRLLDLQPVLERAVQRNGNHQMIGIGTPIVGAGTKAVTASNKLAATAMTIKAAIDNPAVKSRLAIALNKAGKNIQGGITLNTAYARIAAYSNALGNAANQAGSGSQSQPEQ